MVELKRKVTLKTKVADVTTPSDQPVQSESLNSNPKNKGNGKKWSLLIVLVAVVVIAFLLFKPGKTDNDSFVMSQTVAETVENNTSETSAQVAEQGTSEVKANEDVVETNPDNSENVTTEKNESMSNTDSEVKVSQDQEQSNATTSVKKASSVTQTKNMSVPEGTLEEKAKLVIRGDFGNGEERKIKLGSEYSAIQGKVNEMYAKGLVY